MFSLASNWLRRVFFLIPAVGLCLLSASCDDFFVSESSISSVKVSPSAVILQAGATPADTFTFSSTATTVGGTAKVDTATATWTSSDTTVVTAASGGVVTAATSTGGLTATITATDGGKSGTATVLTYTGTAPTTVTLTFPGTITPTAIARGTGFKVTATANLNGNPNTDISNFVTWTIINSTATGTTIDTKGNVTVGNTAGNFTVQAVAQFGSVVPAPGTITATLTFTVV